MSKSKAMQAMVATDRKTYWQDVYKTKGETEVSWFQESPTPSLALLDLVGAEVSSAIIDIGGGASRLVDALLAKGYQDITILDLSAAALDTARIRVGKEGNNVKWIAADVTDWQPPQCYDIWHDRAAFHFLVTEKEKQAYIDRLRLALRPGGYLIIGTFALDGPEKCSGLPVNRYSADSLAAILGTEFVLIDSRTHEHRTPWGSFQKFQFSTFKRKNK